MMKFADLVKMKFDLKAPNWFYYPNGDSKAIWGPLPVPRWHPANP